MDGVTESLTTDLSRIAGSFVIARNTAFTFKSKPVDVKKIGRELNVRYVLEGSVQRGSNRLRVNVQLIDAETSNHVWADRFDKPIADLFDMQDEIVSRLANTLDAQLTDAEARRAEGSMMPDATDLVFQGKAWINKGITPEYMSKARGFFERALALDPNNVEALHGVSIVDATIGGGHLTDDRANRFASSENVVKQVLSMAPDHAGAHVTLGAVYVFTGRAAQSIAEFERALALNPNYATAHGFIGCAKYYLGRGVETEAHVQEAFRLSPKDSFAPWWMVWVGLSKLNVGEDAEAAIWFRRSIEANRNVPAAHFYLASALAMLGSLHEARTAASAGLAIEPGFTVRRSRSNAPSGSPEKFLAQRERIYEGLRIAGIREG